jgi:hypothetical protein
MSGLVAVSYRCTRMLSCEEESLRHDRLLSAIPPIYGNMADRPGQAVGVRLPSSYTSGYNETDLRLIEILRSVALARPNGSIAMLQNAFPMTPS